ncbi:MAG: C69 family dipeptidase [Bacilli bacterium]|nr:C69 family dipeptidase [Bacilli bacterium]MDD4065559.1 C69 family dipeptidase [Bacilli bacterium]
MPCTTLLVGKKASYDGSTLIARNEDSPAGMYSSKKLIVVDPKDQPRKYKSKISQVEIDLPDNPLSYTSCPNADPKMGTWAAAGINSANVSMTATETITTNPRVFGADPLIEIDWANPMKKKKKGAPNVGIGEEDLVVITLPYVKSAKEGAKRLGMLLEKYGTYECNGIAFSDKDEIWWLETIGGHNWIAKRVKDEEYVIMPNQFGLDNFDFNDAYGAQKENMCSKGLKELTEKFYLDLNLDQEFNPRLAYGSHSDSDHVYNTPRAWYMARYFNPKTYKWDGPMADYMPESDDIPWSLVPEHKITVEDVKYILSSHYQGTPYDPYSKDEHNPRRGIYRPIGVNRTNFLTISQIRGYVPAEISSIEWICFGSNVFNAIVPIYANTTSIPSYLAKTSEKVTIDNFYWASRLIGALADPIYRFAIPDIERYQDMVAHKSRVILNKFDKEMSKKHDYSLISRANEDLVAMVQVATDKAVSRALWLASNYMKNAYSRSDQ